jgi:hypothetical protein
LLKIPRYTAKKSKIHMEKVSYRKLNILYRNIQLSTTIIFAIDNYLKTSCGYLKISYK